MEEEEVHELQTWEIERMKRIQQQEEDEKRQIEEMKKKAEQEKAELLSQLKQEKKPPPQPDHLQNPQVGPDEDGWDTVMQMVEPYRKDIPYSEKRRIRRLFEDMKH